MADMIYLAIMADPTLSDKQRECEKRFKSYVDDHRDNVKRAWNMIKDNVHIIDYIKTQTNNISFLIATIDSFINAHDMSKYSLAEWEPTRINFYPVDDQEKEDNIAAYEKAWEHHYTTNMHHWNWWAKTGNKDKMSLEFVIEMCCDWVAMSIKFGGDAYHWYLEQTDIVLGEQQKEWMITILKLLYDIK